MMAQTKLSGWLMGGFSIALLALLLPGTVLADGGDGTTVTVGGYQVSLVFAETVKADENPFHILIHDAMGMPVSNAQVEISAMPVKDSPQHQENMENSAPAKGALEGMNSTPTAAASSGMSGMSGMAGMEVAPTTVPINEMPEMADETDHLNETIKVLLVSGEEAGEYSGEITFPQAGHWMMTTHFLINGETFDADFPVEVTGSSSAGFLLAGFAGLNMVIIGTAAITKRKLISS
jgi:hypothetical protein